MRLNQVIDELVEERGLDRQILSTIVCNGMLSAYEKKYPHLVFKVDYDSNEDLMTILVEKEVAAQVEDDETQISTRKAHGFNKKAEAGDKIFVPFLGKIGRIEILRAKQVIANSIRQVEAEVVYNEFKSREGEIIHGTIHKCERGGAVVKLGEASAFLPKSLMIPGDKCIAGYPVRALLKEVLVEPRSDNQLILDRASEKFLQHLVELEIPEVFERIVEIKKIVRIPGYKSKVAVTSHDQNIDPVGTCIGVGGARIKPILKELGGEKIDVVTWSESPESFVRDALKPAQVRRVEIVGGDTANVWIAEDQRSVAIGKMGQNIALASRLTGYNINLMEPEDDKKGQGEKSGLEEEIIKNQMEELGKQEEVKVEDADLESRE